MYIIVRGSIVKMGGQKETGEGRGGELELVFKMKKKFNKIKVQGMPRGVGERVFYSNSKEDLIDFLSLIF